MASEQVRFDILIEAKVALATMKEMLKDTQDNNVKMKAFSNVVLESSRAWGVSWQYALGVYRQLNAELSKAHKPTLFGNVGGQDLFGKSEQYIQALQDTGRATNGLKVATNGMVEEVKKVPPVVNKTSNAFGSMINVVKGAITAMLTLAALRAITNFFKEAVENANKFRQQLVQLDFSEAVLSKRGMDITRAELDKFVSDIEEKFKYLSKLKATTIVAETASAVSEFNVSKEQLGELSKAIAFIQLKQKALGQEEADAAHIINAAMDARSNFFNGMGINITKSIVDQKAYNMELAEMGEELTKDQRFLAIQALLIEQTSGKTDELLESIKGTKVELDLITEKDWEGLTTQLGMFLTTMSTGFKSVYVSIKDATGSLVEFLTKYGILDSIAIATFGAKWKNAFDGIAAAAGGFLYQEGRKYDNKTPKDTPPSSSASEKQDENNQKMQEKLDEFNQEILDSQLKLAQDMEDAAIDLGRKLYDITVEYEQKRADAYRDYANRISDINRNYAKKLADIKREEEQSNAEARNKELQKEREFQNKMQEMKENFLMDLDDALHARDARQILKLIKQYNLNKLQAERQHKLDLENDKEDEKLRKKSFERKRQDAERERKEQLADAARDYAEKLSQLQRAEAEERRSARLSYQRKLEDLKKATYDRLKTIADGLGAEYNLTKQGLDAIYALYRNHYSRVQQLAAGSTTGTTSPTSSGGLESLKGKGGSGGHPKFAGGGMMLADRPTSVMFGEAGLELATFTPLERSSRNTLFSNVSSEGANGKISIELLLSPDLESRIISNTLNQTAEVIVKLNRTK